MRQNGERRLLRLIDQIMDLRKVRQPGMKLNPSTGEVRVVRAQDLRIVRLPGATTGID